MKLAYQDLKALVKEALIEILQEGIGTSLFTSGIQQASMPVYDPQQGTTGLIENAKPNKSLTGQQSLNQSKADTIRNKKPITTPGISEAKDLQRMKSTLSSGVSQEAKALKESIKSVTDDPILASIFADTAKTTLNEQNRAERTNIVAADRMSQVVAESDPLDLFGNGVADNWEKLAFSSKDLTKR